MRAARRWLFIEWIRMTCSRRACCKKSWTFWKCVKWGACISNKVNPGDGSYAIRSGKRLSGASSKSRRCITKDASRSCRYHIEVHRWAGQAGRVRVEGASSGWWGWVCWWFAKWLWSQGAKAQVSPVGVVVQEGSLKGEARRKQSPGSRPADGLHCNWLRGERDSRIFVNVKALDRYHWGVHKRRGIVMILELC